MKCFKSSHFGAIALIIQKNDKYIKTQFNPRRAVKTQKENKRGRGNIEIERMRLTRGWQGTSVSGVAALALLSHVLIERR